MKADIDFSQISHAVSHFMHRYHIIIFTLIVVGSLSVATFVLYQVVNTSQLASDDQVSTGFDKKTMEKINTLSGSDDAQPTLVPPAGRTNPFKE